MAQLFSPYADMWVRVVLFALAASPAILVGGGYAITRSPLVTGQFLFHTQPSPSATSIMSASTDSIAGTATSARRIRDGALPPTEVCMTCHSQLFAHAEVLEPVRESLAKDRPIAWTRVHALPDYVYFDHSIHIAKGVGCTTCHGEVERMFLTRQATPMTMGWCLDCHRNPAPHLRDPTSFLRRHGLRRPTRSQEGLKLMPPLSDRHHAFVGLFGVPPVRPPGPGGPGGVSRRAALSLLAAGAASMAAGCKQPDEETVANVTLEELPYVKLPEGLCSGRHSALCDRPSSGGLRPRRAGHLVRGASDQGRG